MLPEWDCVVWMRLSDMSLGCADAPIRVINLVASAESDPPPKPEQSRWVWCGMRFGEFTIVVTLPSEAAMCIKKRG